MQEPPARSRSPKPNHLGASDEYFFGMGHGEDGDADGDPSFYAVHISNLLFEPGYDIALAPAIVLRPQLGVGLTFAAGRPCADCGVATWDPVSTATVGVLLLYDFGPAFANSSAGSARNAYERRREQAASPCLSSWARRAPIDLSS